MANTKPSGSRYSHIASDYVKNTAVAGDLNLSLINELLFPAEFVSRRVLEFVGGEGCGKTELLMHIICRTILPRTYAGILLSGLGQGVVFIDTDSHFNLPRLIKLLRITTERSLVKSLSENGLPTNMRLKYAVDLDKEKTIAELYTQDQANLRQIYLLKRKAEEADSNKSQNESVREDILSKDSSPKQEKASNQQQMWRKQFGEEARKFSSKRDNELVRLSSVVKMVVDESMKKFHYTRCCSSEQIAVTIYSLDDELFERGKVKLVLLDSVSAFYWQERLEQEEGRKSLGETQKLWVQPLLDLVKEFRLTLIATNQILMYKRVKAGADEEMGDDGVEVEEGEAHDYMSWTWRSHTNDRFEINNHQLNYVENGNVKYTRNFIITDEGILIT